MKSTATTTANSPSVSSQENTAAPFALDHARVSRIVSKEYSGLLALLQRKLKDRGRASDLVNEAIAVTLDNANQGKLTDIDQIGGYVFKVSMNLLRNEVRNFDNRHDIRSAAEVLESLPYTDENEIETSQLKEMTTRLLRALPSIRDREVIKRFYLDEEDKLSICRSLGLTPMQFTQVVSRARKRMRKIFESKGHQRHDLLSAVPLAIIFLSSGSI